MFKELVSIVALNIKQELRRKKKHSNMTDEVQQHQPQQLDVESGQSLLRAQKDQEKDE